MSLHIATLDGTHLPQFQECEDQHPLRYPVLACVVHPPSSTNPQSRPTVTTKTIDSPSIRQLSRREPSWLETEVANMVVGAESNVGNGGGAAVCRRCVRRLEEVLACGEEACSREESSGWKVCLRARRVE